MNRRLGHYWYLLLITCTVLPAFVVAAALLYQLYFVNKEAVIQQLNERAIKRAAIVEFQIAETAARLEQAALDQNLILSPSNSVFAASTREILNAARERYGFVTLLQVYDTESWPVETVPVQFELQTPEAVAQNLAQAQRSSTQQTQYALIPPRGADFVRSTDDFDAGASIHVLVPLMKHIEGSQTNKQRVGYLSAVLSLDDLFDKQSLSPDQELSLGGNAQRYLPFSQVALDPFEWITVSTQVNIADQMLTLKYAERTKRLMAPVVNGIGSAIALVALFLVLALIIAYWAAKRFARPFTSIRSLINDYASGDFSAPLPATGFVESAQLVNLLGKMAAGIEEAHSTLEQKIEERTIDLEVANSELLRTLNQMHDLQEQFVEAEKMSSLGLLVAGISHEINTPIGVALTAASTLESFTQQLQQLTNEDKLTKSFISQYTLTTEESMRILIKNLKRAVDIIGNFKEVAVDQSAEDIRRFNLKSYVLEVLATLKPQTRQFQVDFVIDISSDIEMYSFPGAVAQIVTNLVVNSVSHGFSDNLDNQISIVVTADGDELVLDYRDNGSGINEKLLPQVFEPFFTTKRGEGGSGLGMHIVYNLVTQKLKGCIETPATEEGVYFRLRVPCDLTASLV